MARRNTAASKKAAELSAGFAAREEELQNLAVEFFNLEEKSDYGSVQKVLQGDLFEQDNTLEPHQLLQEPRFQGRIKYYCSHECNGHEQMFLDWEFEALARRHNQDTEEVAREAIFKKYHSILDPNKEPLLYVGNQKKYPAAFSVLGIQRTA